MSMIPDLEGTSLLPRVPPACGGWTSDRHPNPRSNYVVSGASHEHVDGRAADRTTSSNVGLNTVVL